MDNDSVVAVVRTRPVASHWEQRMGAEASAGLQSQIAQLTSLYGQLPVGVAIFDMDLLLLHANASWVSFVEHAAGVPADHLQAGARLSEIVPAGNDDLLAALERVRGSDTIQKSGNPFAGPDGVTYWDISLAPVIAEGVVTGVISVIADATARIVGERAAAAKERLTAFRADVSQALASSDDVSAVLQSCAEAMVRHAPAARSRSAARRAAGHGSVLRLLAA